MAVLTTEEPTRGSSDEGGEPYCNPLISNYGSSSREINREEKVNYSLDHEIKKIDDEISQFNDDYEGYGGMITNAGAATCSTDGRSRASSLSYEALQLLRHASRSLMKKKTQRRRRRRRVVTVPGRKLVIEAAAGELSIEAAGDHYPVDDTVHIASGAGLQLACIRSARGSANNMKAAGRDQAMMKWDAGELDIGPEFAMEAASAGAGEVAMGAAGGEKINDDGVILYKELQSLRSMIPSHIIHAGRDLDDAEPCLVRDALSYLKFLKQEIKSLKEGLTKPLESRMRTCFDAQVDVNMRTTERLEVKVSCKKRVGLLAELMVVFESEGFIFDSFDVSCHQRFLLRASSTQKGICYMDTQAIRRAILMAIYRT